MNRIKKCPFCGGEATLCKSNDRYYEVKKKMIADFSVKCEKCSFYSPPFRTEVCIEKTGKVHIIKNGAEDAIAFWNRREGETYDES